jgi:chromosome segregation ATPase
MAEERLTSLKTVHEHMEALRGEADARERGLHELAAVIAARDSRISELEQMAEERLSKLNTVHEHLEALRGVVDERERGLHELTSVIAARDATVAELEGLAEERLAHIGEIQYELTEAIAKQEVQSNQILALEHESLVKYLTRRFHKLGRK